MPADAAAEGRAALAALDRALAQRPERDGQAFTDTTEHLCRMRDLLIAERRRGGGPGRLEVLNAIISTALAGHFPLGQTPWDEVEQARGALRRLVEDGGEG
ncbi:hypothetical protein [Paracraurococcus lichenis]|uniref:Uncharacterized protein n=1 Tax=Paracraurococcus lichenis TaxID=3064888 RepID=A0ABT9DY01_9PROT|nr:hypothetical protein [Paracraurococcus sp. LOR1-02]MDO9708782.1 hypothetical protein [Paracraurococcus sp. LOR1-02]